MLLEVGRNKRHEELRSIVAQRDVRKQSELVSLLRKRGFSVTQASVSRDLEELGIEKRSGIYRPSAEKGSRTFGDVSLQAAGPHLLVAKCKAGSASALAVAIDAASYPEVVGTIAGDDTVFIATRGKAEARVLERRLLELI